MDGLSRAFGVTLLRRPHALVSMIVLDREDPVLKELLGLEHDLPDGEGLTNQTILCNGCLAGLSLDRTVFLTLSLDAVPLYLEDLHV